MEGKDPGFQLYLLEAAREEDDLRKFRRTCHKFFIIPFTLAKIYPAERRVLTVEAEMASSRA
jgi:hypothetical protein